MLAAAVVAPPRQSFRIFVGKDRPLRFENGLADDVFRGNELDLVALARELALDHIGHLGMDRGERGREQIGDIGVGSRRIGHGMSRCCCGLGPPRPEVRGADSIPGPERQAMGTAASYLPTSRGRPGADTTMRPAFVTCRRMLGEGLPAPALWPWAE